MSETDGVGRQITFPPVRPSAIDHWSFWVCIFMAVMSAGSAIIQTTRGGGLAIIVCIIYIIESAAFVILAERCWLVLRHRRWRA